MPQTVFLDESLRAAIIRAAEQKGPSLPASRWPPITRVSKPPILPSIPLLRHRHQPPAQAVNRHATASPPGHDSAQLPLLKNPATSS